MDAVSKTGKAALACRDLDISIGALRLVTGLEMAAPPGQLVCVIGCNGAGKTTLLHTLAGLHAGHDKIDLDDTPLAQQSRQAIARRLAVLLQRHDDAFPMTVMETVIGGRHPHSGFLDWESEADREIAGEVLDDLDLTGLGQRETGTLSGGERQRVALAAVLAQRPLVYLLDEPLNNLDPRHQLEVMRRLRIECERGASVLAVMHDLNLVARFADRVLLLHGPERDGKWAFGSVDECMTALALTRLYGVTVRRHVIEERTVFFTDAEPGTSVGPR